MPEFQVIPASRTTNTETSHGFAVERRAPGEATSVVSKLFSSREEARREANRMAKAERDCARLG